METWEWIAIGAAAAAAVLVLGAVFVLTVRGRRRRNHLRDRFGPEYERAVARSNRREAERQLSTVEQEHEDLELRTLPAAARERYREEWRLVETRFVSDPRAAVRDAERVVTRILEERGYPVDGDPERHAAHIAADHPDGVERYRHARALLDEVDGPTSTESMRKAMLDFRAVFEELLEGERTAA